MGAFLIKESWNASGRQYGVSGSGHELWVSSLRFGNVHSNLRSLPVRLFSTAHVWARLDVVMQFRGNQAGGRGAGLKTRLGGKKRLETSLCRRNVLQTIFHGQTVLELE